MNLMETLNLFEPMTFEQRKLVMFKFGTSFEFAERDFQTQLFGLKYRGHTGNLIDKQIYFLGAYEEGILNFIRDTFADGRGTFVDIGANVGVHTLTASTRAKEVHAFEPYEFVRRILEERVSENRLGNICVHSYGLGKTDSEAPFYIPPQANLGAGTFRADFSSGQQSVTLPLRKGSTLMSELGISDVRMIKIDVEGMELDVLEGLAEFISEQRPIVLFEYSHLNRPALEGRNVIDDILRPTHNLWVVRNPNFPKFDLLPWTQIEYGNVLAIPRPS